ncbi:MAG TPA: hypothetical protein VLB27_00620, partial [candidate division Zixibacteria bacterium]|nr:hypothetical protein [candidate division Zixibacteria bacterium]
KVTRSEDHMRSIGLFARLRRAFADNVSVELWADLSRWEPQGVGIRRFYGFLRFLAPVTSGGQVRLASKLAYRYDASAGVRSRIVARLEVEALW